MSTLGLEPNFVQMLDTLQPEPSGPGVAPQTPLCPTLAEGASTQPPPPQAELWAHIPVALRERAQWCVAGPNKAPHAIGPKGLYLANVTDPNTWGTFEDVAAYAHQIGAHIGFVLCAGDGFTCIDLDVKDATNEPSTAKHTTQAELDRYWRIVQAFDSYTERSRSGRGLHIWVRGEIGLGGRRDGVEVYSQERFIITTGATLQDKPLEQRQQLLDMLMHEIRSAQAATQIELEELEEEDSDATVFQRASEADNGDKFNQLCSGEWQGMGYPSQSEADLALMSIFTFYSRSNEQCRRLFRMTGLGKREKAIKNDKYLSRTLRTIRGRQAFEACLAQHGREVAEAICPSLRKLDCYKQELLSDGRDEESWIVSIGDVLSKPSVPPEFLTEQLMPAGEVTLFAAHGGTGKSLLMLMWAVHAALGRGFLGKDIVQAPVIFYSGEDRADTIRFRLAKICQHLECDPEYIASFLTVVDATDNPVLFAERFDKSRGKYTATTPAYDRLKRLGDKRGVRYFFIDNASDTFDADEIKRTPVRQFLRALRDLGKERRAGVMLAAHVDKDTARGGGRGQDYSGSTAWNNSVRSRLFMGAISDEDPGLELRHGKSNHGRLAAPMQLSWNEDGLLEMCSLEEAMHARTVMDDIQLNEVLRVIELLVADGINIPTANSGSRTTYHVLREHPLFPKEVNAKRVNALVQRAEIAKKIRREEYSTAQRKLGSRWVLF